MHLEVEENGIFVNSSFVFHCSSFFWAVDKGIDKITPREIITELWHAALTLVAKSPYFPV